MPLFYAAPFAFVEVQLSTRTLASLEAGWQRLHDLYEVAESEHNTRFLIETLALQALVSEARRDRRGALELLERAVALAEPANIIRVFVDLGPEMAVLLRELGRTAAAPEFAGRLLSAFSAEAEPFWPSPMNGSDRGMGNRIEMKPDPLVEPLSQRELEVLSLLRDRLSNKEIAKELSISPMTVKRHTVNIYQKLAVGGRRDAVTRAAELDLLPDRISSNPRYI